MTSPVRRRVARERGFSFLEIMVVMGIIAVLAGLGVVVVQIMAKKGPKMKTELLGHRLRATIDSFYGRFGAYPPTDPTKIWVVTNVPTTRIAKVPSAQNLGIRSLYICINLQAFGKGADLQDDDLMNQDGDALDKPVEGLSSPKLFEIKDAYGNPFVYINSQEYAAYTKDPPLYMAQDTEGNWLQQHPKPWRSEKTGAFEQPRSFQLFSMGPDGIPNTEDDIKAWE